MKKLFLSISIIFFLSVFSQAQDHSIAREWNEFLLESIRNDRARPTVHSRNLWHLSVLMYDCWAIFDEVAEPYFLGQTVHGFETPFEGFPIPTDVDEARRQAISYAAFQFLKSRYRFSPGFFTLIVDSETMMLDLGYDPDFNDDSYQGGDARALGIYIANQMITYGFQDGSNEAVNYSNFFYEPNNPPLFPDDPGNPDIQNLNSWQPLTLSMFVDQSGNPQGNTPPFLGPEWGMVNPFSMEIEDATVYERDGFEYRVYHDPGPPPTMDSILASEEYKFGFSMVPIWSSHLDPNDDTMIDISPGALGNLDLPNIGFEEYPDFYNYIDGGIFQSQGHNINPITGQQYEENLVKLGDYTRILAEFWADGPDSETPPGHWFTLLNYVIDHPEFERKFRGIEYIEDPLEYDVKAYFVLGGAMHDCAISAWGIKGYYDYIRPVSAIRAMADNGQSSDPSLANYSNLGMPLVPGKIELVEVGDPLAGSNDEHVGKIKLLSWKGPDFINDPATDVAGVDWILGENWWPYQRPTFVTPNFAGYVSGHSTFSRAAAEVLTSLTGDKFFPGGKGEFIAKQNEFLVFEEGPSEDIVLQWATYQDASDQTSLSRIWGGIHPPADDIPGRLIGMKIAESAFSIAESYFYNDEDNDGFYNYIDCDDTNPVMNPSLTEVCDDYDNDCNGIVNDGVATLSYYFDTDLDGFGEISIPIDTCILVAPPGYVDNSIDCNDLDETIFPGQVEICDAIDNDCDGSINNGLARYTYYLDFDADGFGDINIPIDTCITNPPMGYVVNFDDCNDNAQGINPASTDIPDNLIDEDCSGYDLYEETKFLGNGIRVSTLSMGRSIEVHYNYEGSLICSLYSPDGKLVINQVMNIERNFSIFDVPQSLNKGIYFLRLHSEDGEINEINRVFIF